MSRLTGSDAKNLMEAYASVYAPQELTEEQIWEEVENWVNSLLEEGYDLSDYTWEEMYEEYLNEGPYDAANVRKAQQAQQGRDSLAAVGGYAGLSRAASAAGDAAGAKKYMQKSQEIGDKRKAADAARSAQAAQRRTQDVAQYRQAMRPGSSSPSNQSSKSALSGRVGYTDPNKLSKDAAADLKNRYPITTTQSSNDRGGAGSGSGGGSRGGNSPASPTQKPPTLDKPKVNPTKPAGSAMDQWAKANPKLAAAAAEKARIRGTQQTDNPLMKDMKSKLPMNSPSVQSPAVSKLGAGNQSLSQNPNAFKAATPSKAIAAAPSTSAAASGSVAPATAALAATPKPTPVAPRQTAREKMLNQSYEYDAFDLVLEYLIDNGHVETVDEALYVMMEMDAEVIRDIVEEVINEGANYDKNRRRAAQRAAARNAARDAGQTGAVPGVGYVTPRRESETYRDSAGVERHKTGARMPKKD